MCYFILKNVRYFCRTLYYKYLFYFIQDDKVTTGFGLYLQAHFYELQYLASSSSIIYLWPDDGLVIETETCCHLVNLNKIK
jgi:hypothetical protein